jgi:hypothetical protein
MSLAVHLLITQDGAGGVLGEDFVAQPDALGADAHARWCRPVRAVDTNHAMVQQGPVDSAVEDAPRSSEGAARKTGGSGLRIVVVARSR